MSTSKETTYLYTIANKEITSLQEALSLHPFITNIQKGEFDIAFARDIALMQVGYNVHFVNAMAKMRLTFMNEEEFVVEFLDHHLASEFGADLESVNLKQDGISHIKMIYDLTNSLEIAQSALSSWNSSCEEFFQSAINDIIGGGDKARALGGLFADEVFANCWFPAFAEGMKKFKKNTYGRVDLRFFNTHADEVEPAHQDHAILLRGYCQKMNLEVKHFDEAINEFESRIHKLFHELNSRMN